MPERTMKKRDSGLTMVMDKGLSVKDAEGLIEVSEDYVDIIKFGFGTSLLTKNIEEKIKLYKQANIRPYFGGTLFEVFLIRGLLDDFIKYVDKYKIDLIEISDGSMHIQHEEKLQYINNLSANFTILSEVGCKVKGVVIPTETWVSNMQDELKAGSWKVIGEARESGTIGLYNSDGTVNTELINCIAENVKIENVIWEAPSGKQQAWFIKQFGSNVNLGNIAYNDVIPLETLRRGVRGDTFFDFLPDSLQSKKISG